MKTVEQQKKVMDAYAPKKNKPIHTIEDWTGPVFETTPIDEEWMERLQEKVWSTNYKGNDVLPNGLISLRNRLLSFGGEQACLPYLEEDLECILTFGQLWDGRGNKTIFKKGRPSQCHANSADLWEANKTNGRLDGELTIATGYALSKDGMWRQHTWLVLRKRQTYRIIETTKKRLAYYGFALTYEQCEKWVEEHW